MQAKVRAAFQDFIIEAKCLTSQYRSLSDSAAAKGKTDRPSASWRRTSWSRSTDHQWPLAHVRDTGSHVDATPVPTQSYMPSTDGLAASAAPGSHVAVRSARLRPLRKASSTASGRRRWVWFRVAGTRVQEYRKEGRAHCVRRPKSFVLRSCRTHRSCCGDRRALRPCVTVAHRVHRLTIQDSLRRSSAATSNPVSHKHSRTLLRTASTSLSSVS